jgi:HSP20 family protein
MKTVSLYRPASLERAMNDFNRYMESFFDSPLAPVEGGRNHLPLVDVQETDNTYRVEAELPGFEEKNIQVHVDGGNLTIESAKEEDKKEKKDDGTYLIRERRTVSFSRSFKLPENADTEAVEAVFKNGVLTLEIKKREEAPKKRLIQINAR